MYVYTTAARIRAGGTAQIESDIREAFNRINESFQNSNMDLTANLIHMEEISYDLDSYSYDEYGKIVYLNDFNKCSDALNHLVSKGDEYMNNVHVLRDKYSADFVQLILANDGEHGLTYTNSSVVDTLAFSEITVEHMNGASVHELGHALGMQHNAGADGNGKPTRGGSQSYAWGYSNGSIKTIMAGGSTSINYWSSPLLSYNGSVLGETDIDARRAILENAPKFSNYRKRPVTTTPTLSITPPSETFDNSVTIEVNGEAGYEVYVDGVYKGVLDSGGKKSITLNLPSAQNNFSITLKHEPSGTVSNTLQLSIIKKIDTDSDGIYDHIEEALGLNPNSADSDGDGYTDLEEVGDINNPKDTDGDGTIDALDLDSDNNGVSDKDERLASIIITTIIVPYILNK